MAITQATHGFVVKDSVYHNGTIWVKAQANAIATALTVAVVESVADVNTFTAVMGGKLTTTGITAGSYYLSAATAGLLTKTVPTAAGQFRQPVMIAISTTEAYVLGFPAQTTALSDNVADLADYETGTWTPTLTFGGLSVGITYSSQVGRYTKIGDRVFFQIWLNVTAKGSSTGSALLTGLPFTSNAATNSNSPLALRLSGVTFDSDSAAYIAPADTEVNLNGISNAGVLNTLDDLAFAATSTIMVAGQYGV